jgi:hypothetical protein
MHQHCIHPGKKKSKHHPNPSMHKKKQLTLSLAVDLDKHPDQVGVVVKPPRGRARQDGNVSRTRRHLAVACETVPQIQRQIQKSLAHLETVRAGRWSHLEKDRKGK